MSFVNGNHVPTVPASQAAQWLLKRKATRVHTKTTNERSQQLYP